MPTVTVLEKLYSSVSPAVFEERYSSLVTGLDVQLRFAGTTEHGWVRVDVSGVDQTIALSLLDREYGLAPESLDGLGRFSVLRGRIVSGKSENAVCVELPVGTETLVASVSEEQLCGQLADGKRVPFQRLVELFCLVEGVPVEVKLSGPVDGGSVEVALSEGQVSLFRSWVQFRFDRLIVLRALFSDVEHAIKSSRHFRDVIKTESLGVLEQVVLCKLGTDAVGLIPKLGRYLKSAVLVPFSPKNIIKEIGSQPFDD